MTKRKREKKELRRPGTGSSCPPPVKDRSYREIQKPELSDAWVCDGAGSVCISADADWNCLEPLSATEMSRGRRK